MSTVNEVVPPRCFTCDAPLTANDEINRVIDYGQDICNACVEADEHDDCDCCYGFFHGGDPRRFQPDDEMNTEAEIAAWRALCEAWERGEPAAPSPEEHGPWIEQDGTVTLGTRPSDTAVGVCRASRSLGMGATYCAQHGPPLDSWKRRPSRDTGEASA